MIFGGLLKLTLLDYPNHMACTVFTNGCNMRCPFCHNAHLVAQIDQQIDQQEVLDLLHKRKGVLEGICISGGEPLMQKDIVEFVTKVKQMGYKVKLDTNGTSYDKLRYLIDNKLVDYVAMDVKNSKALYNVTCGCEVDLDTVCKCVDLLLLGKVDYEFRTTLCHPLHDSDSIKDMAEWLKDAKHWYLQQFVDSGNLVGEGVSQLDKETMENLHRVAVAICPTAQLRGVK
ncbi:MAG: anaerobic ribonucleoside-triphosphate reductase activating protein [Clostridia bacterium]|nr:anaerobic ribonucleoside-triphosphate reductase activating protein [Clostridia bacterium]